MQYLRYEIEYTPISSRYNKKRKPRRTAMFLTSEQAIRIAKEWREDERVTDVKIIELTITEKEIEF